MIFRALRLTLPILALAASLTLLFGHAHAQPATWNYSAPGNVSTATYPGNVNVGGSLSCGGGPCSGVTFPLVGNCGTVTISTPCLDLSETWNNAATTFTGLKFRFTKTAFAASSLLLDLDAQFTVRADGWVAASGGGIFNGVSLGSSASQVQVGSTGSFEFTNGSTPGTGDVILKRQAANTLAQRNGASAQSHWICNNYTDSSNYECGKAQWSSNVFQYFSNSIGTGTSRSLAIKTDGGTITMAASGDVTFGTGNLLFSPNNTVDIGSTANSPRNSYVGRHLSTPIGGTTPSVSSCGSGASLATNSTDMAGAITVGTTATSCTLTFGSAYTNAPACIVQESVNPPNLTGWTVSNSAINFTMSSTTGRLITYHCIGLGA